MKTEDIIKVLKFYANLKNYKENIKKISAGINSEINYHERPIILKDRGKQARDLIKKLEQK